jgi:hypothetical protein
MKVKVLSTQQIGQAVGPDEIGNALSPSVTFAFRDPSPAFAPPAPIYLSRPEFESVFRPGITRTEANTLCCVRNAFLFGPAGFVVLVDGTLIRESLLSADEMSIIQNLRDFLTNFPGSQFPWARAESPIFALSGYSPHNYFHFLTDGVSELGWRDDAPQINDFHWVVGGATSDQETLLPFIPEVRHELGGRGIKMAPFGGGMLYCDMVVFAVRSMGATPRRVSALRKLFSRYRSLTKPTRKLFVTRPQSGRRKLLNIANISNILDRFGFEWVEPGGLPLHQQVKLFSEANVICGLHGAALTNAAFMQPGGAMIELSHDALLTGDHGALVGSLFCDLAAASDLTYACVVGNTVHSSGDALNEDCTIDPEDLTKAIEVTMAAIR